LVGHDDSNPRKSARVRITITMNLGESQLN
jgi:hypothetical protein